MRLGKQSRFFEDLRLDRPDRQGAVFQRRISGGQHMDTMLRLQCLAGGFKWFDHMNG